MGARTFSENEKKIMRTALGQAQIAASHEDVPVGAVIIHNPTGEIIAVGHNTREVQGDALGHAEVNAIRKACQTTGNWRLADCSLYVTLEPCPMCAGAILSARIPQVICGAKDPVAGAMGSVWALHEHPLNAQNTQIVFGCLEEESKELLKGFFQDKRN